MKNYIISLEDTEKNTAAPKAKVDVVKYLEELGFVNKYLKFETDSSLKSKIQKYFALKITVPELFQEASRYGCSWSCNTRSIQRLLLKP